MVIKPHSLTTLLGNNWLYSTYCKQKIEYQFDSEGQLDLANLAAASNKPGVYTIATTMGCRLGLASSTPTYPN